MLLTCLNDRPVFSLLHLVMCDVWCVPPTGFSRWGAFCFYGVSLVTLGFGIKIWGGIVKCSPFFTPHAPFARTRVGTAYPLSTSLIYHRTPCLPHNYYTHDGLNIHRHHCFSVPRAFYRSCFFSGIPSPPFCVCWCFLVGVPADLSLSFRVPLGSSWSFVASSSYLSVISVYRIPIPKADVGERRGAMTEPKQPTVLESVPVVGIRRQAAKSSQKVNTMKSIKASDVISAQAIKVDFVESKNSWVITVVSPKTNGGYNLHEPIWTNSTVQPQVSVGQSVVLIPVVGTDGKARYSVLPA